MFKLFILKTFYRPPVNFIFRTLLLPFRNIIPHSLKVPVTGIIHITTDKDKEIKFLSNESCPMARVLFWGGKNYSFEFTQIFKHLIGTSRTFLDIGSNVGYYSLLAKTIKPSIQVFAFEPSSGPYYFLCQNVKLNHFDSIKTLNLAVGNYKGQINFFEDINIKYPYLKHHASGTGNTVNTWDSANFSKYEVELTTINDIANELQIKEIDLIKMDTEGTENLVLKGGIETIIQHQPIIICEVLMNKIEHEIEDIILNQLNYKMFHFESKTNHLIPIEKFQCDDNEPNYFFVPEQRVHEVESFVVRS